jgi:hypothetical protein
VFLSTRLYASADIDGLKREKPSFAKPSDAIAFVMSRH